MGQPSGRVCLEAEGLALGCRQMGVGRVTMGFTLCGGCCGCLLITTIRGQRGQEVILVQNTQIRPSKQGLAIISGRPSKPITHQGSGCSGNLSWLAAGHTATTWSPCLPLRAPIQGHRTWKGGQGSLKSGCRRRGVSGQGPKARAGRHGDLGLRPGMMAHTPGHSIAVSILGARSQGHRAGSLLRSWG